MEKEALIPRQGQGEIGHTGNMEGEWSLRETKRPLRRKGSTKGEGHVVQETQVG
jgi:hypothetical protein